MLCRTAVITFAIIAYCQAQLILTPWEDNGAIYSRSPPRRHKSIDSVEPTSRPQHSSHGSPKSAATGQPRRQGDRSPAAVPDRSRSPSPGSPSRMPYIPIPSEVRSRSKLDNGRQVARLVLLHHKKQHEFHKQKSNEAGRSRDDFARQRDDVRQQLYGVSPLRTPEEEREDPGGVQRMFRLTAEARLLEANQQKSQFMKESHEHEMKQLKKTARNMHHAGVRLP